MKQGQGVLIVGIIVCLLGMAVIAGAAVTREQVVNCGETIDSFANFGDEGSFAELTILSGTCPCDIAIIGSTSFFSEGRLFIPGIGDIGSIGPTLFTIDPKESLSIVTSSGVGQCTLKYKFKWFPP